MGALSKPSKALPRDEADSRLWFLFPVTREKIPGSGALGNEVVSS
jgi:hypothetical protein